jgi:hypothetical protein
MREAAVAVALALAAAPIVAAEIELRARRAPFAVGERLGASAVEPGQLVPLRDGTPLGELVLDAEWSDFRGQRIAPGRYALVYALQPRLKEHAGADVIRDFALLVPREALEAGGETPLDILIAASRRVARTSHPALMALLAGGDESRLAEARGLVLEGVEYHRIDWLALGFVVAGCAAEPEAF